MRLTAYRTNKTAHGRQGTPACCVQFLTLTRLSGSRTGPLRCVRAVPLLQLRHVDSLGAFLALYDIKLDFLSFFKRLEAFAVNSCIMYEYIVSF